MKWILQRYSDDGDSTLGLLLKEIQSEGKTKLHFFCDTLEDEFREIKVGGETRIPAGTYELKILRLDTPLTIKHRKSYGVWFKYHVEITGIPNFKGVYVHAGNTDEHTAGCLLLGYGSQKINGMQSINNSKLAVKDWYGQVYDFLEQQERTKEIANREKVFLEIREEQKLI